MERVYVNGEHSSVLMKSMAKLWKERKYCDAVLDVNSENIELHKLVLLAASPSIINKVNRITDRGTIVIKLEGKCYNKDAAKLCVQYLYKGIAKLTDSNVKSVAKIAEVLELKEILKICASFQDTFKLVKEETSESEVDYGSDTEEETAHDDTAQISENLTVALEEALDNIKHIEERSDKGDPATGTVKMEISMESCLVEASKRKQKQKPEEELETAIESIKDKDETRLNQASKHEMARAQAIKQELGQDQVIKGCTEQDRSSVQIAEQKLPNTMASNQDGASKFVCDLCSSTYTTKKRLKAHKKKVHDGQVKLHQCSYCEMVFKDKCNKKRHEENIHFVLKRFTCEHCEDKFASKVSLQGHLISRHGIGEKPKCERCQKEFTFMQNLKSHQKTCQNQSATRVQCDQCPRNYSSEKNLRAHIMYNHSTHEFVCELCGEKYAYPSSLARHKRKHHKRVKRDVKIKTEKNLD